MEPVPFGDRKVNGAGGMLPAVIAAHQDMAHVPVLGPRPSVTKTGTQAFH